MSSGEILYLQKAQYTRAVETLTLAFQEDILKRAICPNAKRRPGMTRWIMEGTLRCCLLYGEVHATSNVEGVACWLPPGKTDIPIWRMLRAWNTFPGPYLAAGRQARRSTMVMQSRAGAAHKRLAHFPHWYLFALAVRPECQGQGFGGRLLAPMLARADQEGLPCYLETQTEQNVAFYQKRGFAVLETEPVIGLQLWYMLRQPRIAQQP